LIPFLYLSYVLFSVSWVTIVKLTKSKKEDNIEKEREVEGKK
jgi:hypothetical protein